MAGNNVIDPARLYAILMNTGLQQKDQPLYQVLHDLIANLIGINTQVNVISGIITPSTTIPVIVANTTNQQLMSIFGRVDEDNSDTIDNGSFIPTQSSSSSSIIDDNSTNATMFLVWVNATPGSERLETSSTGIIWNPSTKRLSIGSNSLGSISLNGQLSIINTQLDNLIQTLSVTATLPAITTATRVGINFDIFSAGSSSNAQEGVTVNLEAGYTGANETYALIGHNGVAGTASPAIGTLGKSTGAGNQNIGIGALASSSTATIGVFAGVGGIDITTYQSASAAIVAVSLGADLFQGFNNATKNVTINSSGGAKFASTVSAGGANPAITGAFGMPNATYINARNAANTLDLNIIGLGNTNVIQIDPSALGISCGGILTVASSIVSNGGNIQIQTSRYLLFSGQVAIQGFAASQLNLFSSSGAAPGVGLAFATAGVLNIRTTAQTGDASITVLNATSSGTLIDKSYNIATPATLATVVMSANQQRQIINPAGTIAVLTVTLPPTPVDGQIAGISFTQIVSALTVNAPGGATVVQAPTSAAVDTTFRFLYQASSTSWFPAS